MNTYQKDKEVLRKLASRVAEIANRPEQRGKAKLWLDCNKLRAQRPVILADPKDCWPELIPDTNLLCQDNFLQEVELKLRKILFRGQYIRDDFPITEVINIDQVFAKSSYGLETRTKKVLSDGGAYQIEPVIKKLEDLEKLHPAEIKIDQALSNKRYEMVDESIGDLLTVRIGGIKEVRSGLTRILVHLRGLDNMMFDIYDQPELLHQLMSFLRNQQLREIELFEKEGLLSLNNQVDDICGTGGITYTDELPAHDFTGQVRPQDMVAWGESQEFVGVGPANFNEFVFQYQLPVLKQFGLVAYGCCEHLDNKLDLIIKHLPNLRWVAVSPWADRKIAAEKLENNYVYVYKPNPSYICSRNPDFETAEKELRKTLEIAQGCSVQIIMKNTGTFWNEPERITRWTEMAKRVVES